MWNLVQQIIQSDDLTPYVNIADKLVKNYFLDLRNDISSIPLFDAVVVI